MGFGEGGKRQRASIDLIQVMPGLGRQIMRRNWPEKSKWKMKFKCRDKIIRVDISDGQLVVR